jgi:hypothetical protein
MMAACVKEALISLSLIQGAVVCQGFDDSCVRNSTTQSFGDFYKVGTVRDNITRQRGHHGAYRSYPDEGCDNSIR